MKPFIFFTVFDGNLVPHKTFQHCKLWKVRGHNSTLWLVDGEGEGSPELFWFHFNIAASSSTTSASLIVPLWFIVEKTQTWSQEAECFLSALYHSMLNYIVALTLLVYYFFQGWFPVLFVFVFLHLFMYEFNLINLHKFQSKSNICVCVFIQRSDCMHVFSCKLWWTSNPKSFMVSLFPCSDFLASLVSVQPWHKLGEYILAVKNFFAFNCI